MPFGRGGEEKMGHGKEFIPLVLSQALCSATDPFRGCGSENEFPGKETQ